ncbi:MAG: hypothetical protein GY781_04605 [Gammaproteobacteria bacterium]|nr:hypothetical protein [Gammaproteobacteria bacterium]
MRKLSVKIAILLFAILTTIIAAISTLAFLINKGKLTPYIERQIRANTNFDINIADIHLNIFSGFQLKQISVKEFSDQKQFTLECNTLTIRYKPFNLLRRRIRSIDLSDVQIILDIESGKAIYPPSSHDHESSPFSLKDVYPEHLLIENISLNNVKVKTATGGYLFTLTELNTQVKKVQSVKPIAISTQGIFSVSNLRNTHTNLTGRININTKYNLPDDELTILDNSNFMVYDSEKLFISGKALSILASPEIHCNISCNPLLETFKPMIPEKYKDWSLNGTISTDTAIDYIVKNQSWTMTAITDLSLSKLGFASPDYDYFAEGIDGHIKINFNADSNSRKLSFGTNGILEPFIVQLGEFTTDMKGRKTHLSFSGNYDFQNNNLHGIDSALSWDDLGTLTTRGDILSIANNPNLDMNIELAEIDNAAFFETFLKDTVEYSNPELFNARIEGDSNTHLYIKGSKNDLTVNGHLNVKDLSLICGDISIGNTSVDLPVSMTYPRSKMLIRKQDIAETQYGTVQLKKLSYGPLEIDNILFNPLITSNNFFIKDSFKVPVFDGTIDIRNVSVKNIIDSDRKVELRFQLNNISLAALTTTYKLTPFEGILNSSVISFEQQGQRLYSDDEMNIKLFGGEITIRDLTLNNFLKPMAGIGFSAEVKHLDLGKMSNTYREWGNITGIINGNIQDFKIVAGEPSSFEIEMKTEAYPDIKQTVSTKFLKNFVPGIGKVLDKVGFTNYKYAVMGLHARLENDYVKLRGAVREDEKELFMKGAGMKRLEIVFPNVDKRVPFKPFLNSFKGILGSDIDGTQVQFK